MVQVPAEIRKWLPGDSLVEENVLVPDLKAGEYRLRVALLDPSTLKPVVRLGIEGETKDGWYDLGAVRTE